jgi:hypothetical protein
LEPVLVIKIENPDQGRGNDGGHVDPGSHRNHKDIITNPRNFKSVLEASGTITAVTLFKYDLEV